MKLSSSVIADTVAQHMQVERDTLTQRWLRCIAQPTDPRNAPLPSPDVLQHVSQLIGAIANYLQDATGVITENHTLVSQAVELGKLRQRQGCSPQQILTECELLVSILVSCIAQQVARLDAGASGTDGVMIAHRFYRAVTVVQRATTMEYLQRHDEHVQEREQRLRSFNATVSHEFRNRLNALFTSAEVLLKPELSPEARARMQEILLESNARVRGLLDDLTELSQLESRSGRARNVLLRDVVGEVARRVAGMAGERGVIVRVAANLPDARVNSTIVELSLMNYVANAIKYSDPSRTTSWVEIRARIVVTADGTAAAAQPFVVVAVADNGLGVPVEARPKLFQRFFRAHEGRVPASGSGLGLSIVRETVTAAGGRAWAEFPELGGSVFYFSVPALATRAAPALATAFGVESDAPVSSG